ncbi:hypothetical protein Bca52824_045063 [Brassica carinata]|uniref:Uncharacterized protein n=1 Tax=Brassica carinata TaxID=52824 RepID=A0A8X7RHI4_BRACI|nr:hypothetical protein Bca52824_045063 [Brassica carinata]
MNSIPNDPKTINVYLKTPAPNRPPQPDVDDRRPLKKKKPATITDHYVGHGYDNQDLEACFVDIMKEERRSARIAREENEMEAKLIAQEEERERQRKLLKLRHLCLRYQMVTKEEDCLPPAIEPLRCYFPSSTTPLAELETIQSLEIVEPSFLSPAWSMEYSKLKARVDFLERNQRYYVGKDLESIMQGNSGL